MGEKGVKLLGFWASPFALRVEWALKLKGVEYEYVNEDLRTKSPELLKYNPVYKKIPVLVHDGKPIAESVLIIEYIDEMWKDGPPIMPKDPRERALARFWAKFAEEKCLSAIRSLSYKVGEEQQKAIVDVEESLRTLGEALKGEKFFGGETIGYVDIVAGWIPYWLRNIEEIVGVDIVNDANLPSINAWFHDFLDLELVKERLPPRDELIAYNKDRRARLLAEQK